MSIGINRTPIENQSKSIEINRKSMEIEIQWIGRDCGSVNLFCLGLALPGPGVCRGNLTNSPASKDAESSSLICNL